ncbi:hypothetical protein EMCRGX_G018785 [Ephydatia muelleri]
MTYGRWHCGKTLAPNQTHSGDSDVINWLATAAGGISLITIFHIRKRCQHVGDQCLPAASEALGPQGWTECLQDVSLRRPSPFGSILGGTLRASTLTNHVKPMTASWCGTPGRTQGKPVLPWSQVGQRGGPTTHHDHVMVWHVWSHPRQASATLVPDLA